MQTRQRIATSAHQSRSIHGSNAIHLGWRPFVLLGCILPLVFAGCSQPPELPPPEDFEPITSTFETDVEGWVSVELDAPVWQAPGYILITDNGADWQYAVAPPKFHGDWSGAASLRFKLLADPALVEFPIRVIVEGAEHSLYVEYELDEIVPGAWVELNAPLAAGPWRHVVSEQVEGPVATQPEIDEALADVSDLRIRLDVNNKFEGDEANGLDDVVVE